MPKKYVHFTDEQKEQARQTDLCELLRLQGETLKRSGSEYEWKDGSQKVTIRGNLWFHQYDQQGGDAIDFVRRFMGKSYPEAMEYLLGGCGGSANRPSRLSFLLAMRTCAEYMPTCCQSEDSIVTW